MKRLFLKDITMNASVRLETTGPITNLFNQSIGRLRLTQTKNLILASLLVAVVTLLSAPMRADEPSPLAPGGRVSDTFVILLQGEYKPVTHVPDLRLHQVYLGDGSYSTTKIYLSGLPKEDSKHSKGGDFKDQTKDAIGNFYVQFSCCLAAYDLPGGALTMIFDNPNEGFTPVPDGQGGFYLTATFHLSILEATGIYASFQGGENHMVDVLHLLADGSYVEHCYCIISRPKSEG
jgi:hypothetical protein